VTMSNGREEGFVRRFNYITPDTIPHIRLGSLRLMCVLILLLAVIVGSGCIQQSSISRAHESKYAKRALLAISDSFNYDFEVRVVTSSIDQSFVVKNTGIAKATGITASELGSPFSYKGGVFPGTDGTCGGELDVDSTCSVVVSFNPFEAGAQEEILRIFFCGK